MCLLKIGFSRITHANLNGSGQNFTNLCRQDSNLISRVKIWAPWAKRTQNGGEKVGVFVRNTMQSHFFVTGQIGMKFRQKPSIGVLYRTLIEKFRKFSLKGVILPPPQKKTSIFRLFDRSPVVLDAYRSRLRFWTSLSPPSIRQRANCVCTRIAFCGTYHFGGRSPWSYSQISKSQG